MQVRKHFTECIEPKVRLQKCLVSEKIFKIYPRKNFKVCRDKKSENNATFCVADKLSKAFYFKCVKVLEDHHSLHLIINVHSQNSVGLEVIQLRESQIHIRCQTVHLTTQLWGILAQSFNMSPATQLSKRGLTFAAYPICAAQGMKPLACAKFISKG